MTVAFGTSMPTSMTVVAMSTLARPEAKASIASCFSRGRQPPAGPLALPQPLQLSRRRPQLAPRVGAGELLGPGRGLLGLGLLYDRADDEGLSARRQLA